MPRFLQTLETVASIPTGRLEERLRAPRRSHNAREQPDAHVNRRAVRIAATVAALGLLLPGAFLAWRARPIAVEVVLPTRGPAVDAIYATGTVEPSVLVPVAPRVAGHLRELLVDEGARVRKGQVLARLDDTDLQSAVAELAAHERYARDQYDRTQELARRGVVAVVELVRTRSEWEAAQAARMHAESQRAFANLVSPADGTVIRRDGEVGQLISVGQALFDLACCAPLRVTAEVDEEDYSRVHVGQAVLLRLDALPDRILDGDVSEITPKGDPVARSYRVRIHVADPTPLAIGMTADANLIVSKHDNALLIPTSAVQGGAVWTVQDGRLHRQAIDIGIRSLTQTEVLRGLEPRSSVVVSPPDALRDGQRARVHAATGSNATSGS